MNFADFLKENAQKVDKTLESILADFLKETKKTNPKLIPFAESLLNSCKGGKRIRGVLCKLGYELVRTTDYLPATATQNALQAGRLPTTVNQEAEDSRPKTEDIIKIGAAFEILHAALLIHDDIIDQSPQRRGQPSLYKALGGPARLASQPAYRARRGGQGESVAGREHYGISQAISLGDIGLYLPIKIITETSFPDQFKLKAINYFSQILINTGWGQILDVKGDSDRKFINLFKTAKYTIAGPLQIGAILGGADDKLVSNLGLLGENLGIAFQIKDDVLDGELDSETAKSQVLEYTVRAEEIIPKITKDQEIIKMLSGLTEYLVERTK